MYYDQSSFSGSVTAHGGSSSYEPGGAGSICTKASGDLLPDLLVDNKGLSGPTTPVSSLGVADEITVLGAAQLDMTGLTSLTVRTLAVSGAVVHVPLTVTADDLFLSSGGRLNHGAGQQVVMTVSDALVLPTGTSITASLDLTVPGSLTIDSGASISASGRGYGSGAGAGAGNSAYRSGGGGGYGGHGGTGSYRFNCSGCTDTIAYPSGGIAYGSLTEPTEFGSGGGGTVGGSGGGAIRLVVGGILQLDGTIAANGDNGRGNYSRKEAGAGGSGGSVWITAGTLNGSGAITANGGTGNSYDYVGRVIGKSGGGGGGRIALYYDQRTFIGSVTAYGGPSSHEDGEDGTIVSNPMILGGSLYYRDVDGTNRQAAYVKVEAWEKQGFIGDDYPIAEGYTDSDGQFRLTVDVDGNAIVNEDSGLFDSGTRDVYFIFRTENEAALVKNNTVTWVPYTFETDTEYDIVGTDYYRIWHATSALETPDHAAVLGIPGQMERSRLWFEDATGWSRSQITAVYPSWLPTSELFSLIFLREEYADSRVDDGALFVAAHEYGHAVLSAAFDGLPGFTEKEHSYNTETDEWTAIVEGWAEFFSSGVTGETWIDRLGGVEGEYWGDIAGVPFWWGREVGEVDAWHNENGRTGETVEGAVAAIFWDLYDGPDMYPDGDDDGVDGRLLDVWTVLSEGDPTSMWNDDGDETDDFYHLWNARYGRSREVDDVFIDHGMPVRDDSFDALGSGNDLRGSATLLADTTQTYSGLVCIDPDWYRFTTNDVSSDASEIKIEFDPRRGIPDLVIFDAGGNAVAENTEFLGYSQSFKTLEFAAMPAGTYYVRVVGHGDIEATRDLYEGDMSPEYALTLNVSAVPVTPTGVDLLAVNDTGVSNTDNLTNLDNSEAGKTLQFGVSGTVAGATVTIYADGVDVGSAVAAGATTTVVTNGTSDLIDGVHSITARQTEPGKAESAASPALDITVDTAAPDVNTFGLSSDSPDWALGTIDSSQWTTGRDEQTAPWSMIDQLIVDFDEPVVAAIASLTLTGIDAGVVSPTAMAGSGTVQVTCTMPAYLGTDRGVVALSADVADLAGNALIGGWTAELHVLVGDINGDDRVSSRDRRDMRDAYGSAIGGATYTVFADLNGDGRISSRDRRILRDHYGTALSAPAALPAAIPTATLGEVDSDGPSPAPTSPAIQSVMPAPSTAAIGEMDAGGVSAAPQSVQADVEDVFAMAAISAALAAEPMQAVPIRTLDTEAAAGPLVSMQTPSIGVPTAAASLSPQIQPTSTVLPINADAPIAAQLEPDMVIDLTDILGEELDEAFTID